MRASPLVAKAIRGAMALAIGHHVAIGGNKNGFGKFVERVNAAGLPVMVKGTSDAGPVFEAQESGKKYGVDNVRGFC